MSTANRVRIIGGRWRGRRLRFPPAPGLRPTTDRVRETLFNWLQGQVSGVRCLDLYAGSGALGLEAASRGAGEVLLIEANHKVATGLLANIKRLEATNVRLICQPAEVFLRSTPLPANLIFLDPPFGQGRVLPALICLIRNRWLAAEARIYVECEAHAGEPSWPDGITRLRQVRAGEASGYLLAATGLMEADKTRRDQD